MSERPDVQATFPSLACLGFHECLSIGRLPPYESWSVRFLLDGEEAEFPLALETPPDLHADFIARKERKLARIRGLLCCPLCRSEHLFRSGPTPACRRCGQRYGFDGGCFDFLTDDLARKGGVKPTENVSSFGYDGDILRLVDANKNGVVLDAGAGMKSIYYDNVVNLEIVRYPTTDVLGVGERLPFRSDVFDAVVSVAVLEHVRDPFACAQELARVLKPGGVVFAAVPFLQPFHGYPDHYYNMTSSGLRNLFADRLVIEHVGIPEVGHPIYALSWFLNSYSRGLPPQIADEFRRLTVGDLMGDAAPLVARDFGRELSQAAREELACGNYVIGRKAAPSSVRGAGRMSLARISFTWPRILRRPP